MSTGSNTTEIGKVLLRFKKLASTNSYAQNLWQKVPLDLHGLVISTNHQYQGRGQRNNSWQSDPGKNIALSLLLGPMNVLPAASFVFTEYLAVAARECIQSFTTKKVKIKWPNDIILDHKKVAGLLVESQMNRNGIQSVVLGVGLNVNQLEFNNLPFATSLKKTENLHFDLLEVEQRLVLSFQRYYPLIHQRPKIRGLYWQHLWQKEIWRNFRSNDGKIFAGKIMAVDLDGTIQIEQQDGHLTSYFMKEIAFV